MGGRVGGGGLGRREQCRGGWPGVGGDADVCEGLGRKAGGRVIFVKIYGKINEHNLILVFIVKDGQWEPGTIVVHVLFYSEEPLILLAWPRALFH